MNTLDLSPTLTVVIAGANGMSGRQISKTRYMRIAPGDIGRQLELTKQRRLEEQQRLEDSQTWRVLSTLSGHNNSVFSMTFSPGISRIASGARDTPVKVWGPADP